METESRSAAVVAGFLLRLQKRRRQAWVTDDVDDEEEKQELLPNTRNVYPRKNQNESTWAHMLLDPRIKDPSSREGKLFRRRFRLPFPIYDFLLEICKDYGWFMQAEVDCCGQQTSRLDLKTLGYLRVVGRGYCFDGIEELTNISEEVHRVFFHQMNANLCTLYDRFIHVPISEEEIQQEFEMLGLPGCIASGDCVHLGWDRCPAAYRSLACGKEGFPTRAYEVCASHSKRILSVTTGFWGSVNDKTIVKFDGFIQSIHTKQQYSEVKFRVYKENGEYEEVVGLYIIVDGGYHKWRCLQCPLKFTPDEWERVWSKFVESVRKDVECTFGILKGRFRILKMRLLIQDAKKFDNLFIACCILHNILLHYDGLSRAI